MVGAGDIGRRVLANLKRRDRAVAATSTAAKRPALKRLGARAVLADLDKPGTLKRLPRDWDVLVHAAPPQSYLTRDQRTRNLLAATDCGASNGRCVVYLSTSGVYGDCAGDHITETQVPKPHNARARRRLDAERALVRAARRGAFRLIILRVPGIYAHDRLPIARLKAGTPALLPAEDVYTNHIHAADLASIALAAIRRMRRSQRLGGAQPAFERQQPSIVDAQPQFVSGDDAVDASPQLWVCAQCRKFSRRQTLVTEDALQSVAEDDGTGRFADRRCGRRDRWSRRRRCWGEGRRDGR